MREYGYTVIEHDRDRPWIIRDQQHLTVELEDDQAFYEWANRKWPQERFTVQPDPWQLEP